LIQSVRQDQPTVKGFFKGKMGYFEKTILLDQAACCLYSWGNLI